MHRWSIFFFGKNHLTVTGLCKLKGLGVATNDFWESFRLPLRYVLWLVEISAQRTSFPNTSSAPYQAVWKTWNAKLRRKSSCRLSLNQKPDPYQQHNHFEMPCRRQNQTWPYQPYRQIFVSKSEGKYVVYLTAYFIAEFCKDRKI